MVRVGLIREAVELTFGAGILPSGEHTGVTMLEELVSGSNTHLARQSASSHGTLPLAQA